MEAVCTLCPRRCGAMRGDSIRVGICRSPWLPRIARAAAHYGEEPCIAGPNGTGAVFFTGCNLRCVFCQNQEIASRGRGIEITTERLADIFMEQAARGAATLDLVTPTHYAPMILEALRQAKRRGLSIPVVWNSSGYERAELIERIADVVDVFLPDLKYLDEESARRYSGAPDYFRHAARALRAMVAAKGGPVFDASGILTRGVLVRHLVLPGRRRESLRLLTWLWETFGHTVHLSLMNQYTPLGRAVSFPEINRRLTTFEYQSVVEHALALGITHCYVQEGGSASAKFVPVFDGRGVLPSERERKF